MAAQASIGIQVRSGKATLAVVDPATGTLTTATEVALSETGKLDAEFPPGERVVALPEAAVHTRYLEAPGLRGEALENALRSLVMRHFPFDPDRHQLVKEECPSLGDRKTKGFVVFLLDRHELDRQTEVVKLDHLEVGSLALARWLMWEKGEYKKGTHAFVSLDDTEVIVGLLSDRRLYAAQRLVPPLVNLPEWTTADSLQGLEPFVEALASRLAGALSFFHYRLSSRELNVQTVVLTGRFCQDPVLVSALEGKTKVPVKPLVPQRLKGNNAERYRMAAGLSLRSVEV